MEILGKQNKSSSISSIHTVNEKTKRFIKLELDPSWSRRLSMNGINYRAVACYKERIYALITHINSPNLTLYWSADSGNSFSSMQIATGSPGDQSTYSKINVFKTLINHRYFFEPFDILYGITGKGIWRIIVYYDSKTPDISFIDKPTDIDEVYFASNIFMHQRKSGSSGDIDFSYIGTYQVRYDQYDKLYYLRSAFLYYKNNAFTWDPYTEVIIDRNMITGTHLRRDLVFETDLGNTIIFGHGTYDSVTKKLYTLKYVFPGMTISSIEIPIPQWVDYNPNIVVISNVSSDAFYVEAEEIGKDKKYFFVKTADKGTTWSIIEDNSGIEFVTNIVTVGDTYRVIGCQRGSSRVLHMYESQDLSNWIEYDNELPDNTADLYYYNERFYTTSASTINTSYYRVLENGKDVSNALSTSVRNFLDFQNKLLFKAGNNITISQNGPIITICTNGNEYQAGEGIMIDTSTNPPTILDAPYIAGEGIDINNRVISCTSNAGLSLETTGGELSWSTETVILSTKASD